MSNIHELEKALFAAWNTVDDIGLLKEEVRGIEAREAIDAVYWLLDARMSKTFDVFEEYNNNVREEMRDVTEDHREDSLIDKYEDSLAAGSKAEMDEIVEIMHPTPEPYRSIYEDEGALSWKPYRTGQINPHLSGNFRTITHK